MYAHQRRIFRARGAVYGHGDGGVVVFESHELVVPELPTPPLVLHSTSIHDCFASLPRSHMPSFYPRRKAHVYPLDVLGEHERAGAEADGEKLRLQLAHALR